MYHSDAHNCYSSTQIWIWQLLATDRVGSAAISGLRMGASVLDIVGKNVVFVNGFHLASVVLVVS
jgi:hypothetical protein